MCHYVKQSVNAQFMFHPHHGMSLHYTNFYKDEKLLKIDCQMKNNHIVMQGEQCKKYMFMGLYMPVIAQKTCESSREPAAALPGVSLKAR